MKWPRLIESLFALILTIHGTGAAGQPENPQRRIDVVLPGSAPPAPLTGRILVIITHTNEPEVRLQTGWLTSPPVFGVDVHRMTAGQSASINGDTEGYPLRTLDDIPPGDYYIQALLNVYTDFHRADGHVLWAHMDQWEGQNATTSPGNLYSRVTRIHLDPSSPTHVRLELTERIPPIPVPADTAWVKHVKIQSKLLSQFWGRPIYLGAVVLLPRDYATDRTTRYPVIYQQGHFSHGAPFGFSTEAAPETRDEREFRESRGLETGKEFYQRWNGEHFPRVIAVTFLHPTPFYDDSYAVNSANQGPYGDAIMTELIPYIEAQFRIIPEPFARTLTGGSTGGWESLALQLYHPEFFGGAWVFYPDPVDFRRYSLIDIYDDDNAYVFDSSRVPTWFRQPWSPPERYIERGDDGQPIATVRQMAQLETVLGGATRSGGVLSNWEAVYGPVASDGYPQPLWDRRTGKIDHAVALYMREHGFDLREYAQRHWARIGPSLVGKLHFFVGDMDNYYLNLSVYLLEQFLQETKDPYYAGSFVYGRPLKGHVWQPMTNVQLVSDIAAEVARNAPPGTKMDWFKP